MSEMYRTRVDNRLDYDVCISYTEGKNLASIAANYIATNGADALYSSYFFATPVSTGSMRLCTERTDTRNRPLRFATTST